MKSAFLAVATVGIGLFTSSSTALAAAPVTQHEHRDGQLHFTSVDFLNARDAWALNGTRVYITHDGGDSWRNVTPVGLQFPSSIQPSAANTTTVVGQVQSDHSQIGFQAFRTQDGGLHWKKIILPVVDPYAPGLQWISPKVGWLWGFIDRGTKLSLYQTTSGGTHWTHVPFRYDQVGGSDIDFYFVNREQGWLTGMPTRTGRYFLERTTDGGKEWKRKIIFVPRQGFWLSYPPYFSNQEKGIMPMTNIQYLYFYHTNNGGTSWRLGSGLPIVPYTVPIYDHNGHWIMALGQKDGKPYLYASSDWGARWSSKPTPLPFQYKSVAEIDFVNPLHGFVVDDFLLWRTSNGGKTWSLVPSRPTK